MMPGISGREVCRIVRDFSPETKIIYFSARMEQDPQQYQAMRQEADAFIAKPATGEQILTTIREVLTAARRPRLLIEDTAE
jgi:CheY-like chemotaxis protein